MRSSNNADAMASGGDAVAAPIDGEPIVAEEAELRALVKVQRALAPLTARSRAKVLSWFSGGGPGPNGLKSSTSQEPDFRDLSALFEAMSPKSEAERVLAVCYYHNAHRNEPDVGARALSAELKQMGHAARDVSWKLHQLAARTPALVMVAARSGSGVGSKKRYRITSAGVKYIRDLLEKHAH